MKQLEKRLDFLDVCKGIGIVLVILGHIYGLSSKVGIWIYSFHMPLFFILSGLVYNEKKNTELPFFEFLKKKAKSYLVPYYLYALINLVIELLWSKFYLSENVTLSIVSLSNFSLRRICFAIFSLIAACPLKWS